MPNPLWLKVKDEGIETLIQNELVRDSIDRITVDSWGTGISLLKEIESQNHSYTHVVFDVLNGFEWHCHQHTCQRDFDGKWSDPRDGFMSFHKGYDVALQYWNELLALIERIRDKGVGIVGLCHSGIGKVPNPEGLEYTKHAPDMHYKTWAVTAKHTDLILFGRYEVETVEQMGDKNIRQKTKARGGKTRVIVTTSSAGIDAKNRHGLPDEIQVSNESAAEAWSDFVAAFRK